MSIKACYRSPMDRDERERAIIEAATTVFGRRGYTDTRMAEIAREAGMSYGLLYHYFNNKETLFEVLVEEWWQGFHGMLETLKVSPISTEEKLTAIISHVLSTYIRQPQLISIYVKEISRGFAYHSHNQAREKFNRIFELCSDLMAEGQQKGVLRADIQSKYLSYIFLGAIDAFLSVMVIGEENINKRREKKIIEAITRVFLDGSRSGQNTGG